MLGKRMRRIAKAATTVGLSAVLAFGGLPSLATMAWADETPGTLTINQTDDQKGDITYKVYKVFSGDVTTPKEGEEGQETLSNIKWANDATKSAFDAAVEAYVAADSAHAKYSGSTAQDAADYLKANLTTGGDSRIAGSGSLAELLARQLEQAEVEPTSNIKAGEAASLADGYYLVVSDDESLGNGAAGTSPIYTLAGGTAVTITEKVTPPTVNKEVQEDSSDAWGRYADANRDQTVSYRLTATLPSNLASFDSYHLEFVDHLSEGLTYDAKSAKVYVVHANGNEEEVTDSFTITSPATGDEVTSGVYENQTALTVNCANIKGLTLTGGLSSSDKVVVRYTAHLNENSVIGTPGNPNEVKLVYSNNPNVSGDGETELVDPVVYTYQLNVHKQDKDAGTDVGLAGAKFTIQVAQANSDTASRGLYLQEDGSLGSTAYEFTTDASGNISVPRIDEGTYVLHETSAPTGYSLTADTTVKITSTMPEGEDGTLSLAAEVTGNDDAKLSSADASSGTVIIAIKDVKNIGMPQTGSAGFAALMAGGTGMVVLSLAVILRRSRQKAGER